MKTIRFYSPMALSIKLALFTIVTLCGCGNYSKNHSIQRQEAVKAIPSKLLTPAPCQALLNLLNLYKIQHDGSAKDIIEKTQQAWLRKQGTERWQFEGSEKISSAFALPLFDKLCMVQEIMPPQKEYSYALILGATAGSFRNRLAYLVQLWQQGIRFKTIVLLGSERPLNSTVDSDAILKNQPQLRLPTRNNWQAPTVLPTTEISMMSMIYEQVEIPDDMKTCQVVMISSPQTTKPDGAIRRATTADTIIDWLKTNPKPGTCLFISSQPYVGYQHAVAQSILPSNFVVNTVGEGIRDLSKVDISLCLDTLARWLYQECH